MNLARSTLKGMIWAYASFFGGRFVTLASTAILARLLVPQDFGVIGFAAILLNFIESTRSMGINDALIYNTEDVDKAADTAFIINILIGFLQFGIVFALAPLAANFISDGSIAPTFATFARSLAPYAANIGSTSRVVDVVRIMAVAFIFNGFGQTHDALLQKELRFRRRFFPDLLSTLLKGVVSIVMALAGFGLWSLVIGYVFGAIVRTITAWIVMNWRPKFHFYGEKARELWRYGVHILILNTLSVALEQADPLMVGILLGELQLGYYSIASKIPELVILNIGIVMTRVIFPTYVKIKDDRELLRHSYFLTTKYTAFITVAIGFGMSAVAPELIRLLYGPQWEPAIILMRLLPLLGMTSTLAWNAGDVFKAIGRPDVSTKLLVIETIYTFGLLWLFGSTTHLAIMVALANLITFAISAVLRLWLISRFLHFSPKLFFGVFRAPFVGAIAMFISVTLWRELVHGLPNMAVLISSSAVGVVVYVGILWIMERQELVQARDVLLSLVRRTAEPKPQAPAGDVEVYTNS